MPRKLNQPAALAQAIGVVAISRLPTTKPTEVMLSCSPYSNSVAFEDLDGERQEQDVLEAEDDHDRDAKQDHRAQDGR